MAIKVGEKIPNVKLVTVRQDGSFESVWTDDFYNLLQVLKP